MKKILKYVYLAIRSALMGCAGIFLRPLREADLPDVPRKILFIRVDRLGDMTLSTPAFALIRARHPNAELYVLAAPAAAALIGADPSVTRVFVWGGDLWAKYRVLKDIRRAGIDLAVDPLNDIDIKPAFLAFLSGARVRVGYVYYGREVLFNVRVPPPKERIHFSEEAPWLLRAVGISGSAGKPKLFVSHDASMEAERLLAAAGFYERDFITALHPGGYYPSQRWLPERFSEVARQLALERGAKFLLIGKESERALVEGIAASLPAPASALKAIAVRPDILCALMLKCRLFLGNNSGPLHMACALGLPAVSIIGPADPVKWAPIGEKSEVISAVPGCAPCNKGECFPHVCMDGVSVPMVRDGILRVMGWKSMEEKA